MPMTVIDEKVELKRIEASVKIAQINAAAQIVTMYQSKFSNINQEKIVECWNKVYTTIKNG